MARQTDILLDSTAWASGNEKDSQLNPFYGGQFGWAPNPEEWISAQAYIPRNLIPIVLETPKFFEIMPHPDKWIMAWKVFFEKHARVIEGLKAGLTVEVAEHAFGGAGEMFQEYVDVKRERSNLNVTLTEKYGNVWQNYWERVITYGMMDPESKTPNTATMGDGVQPKDNLADWYSGTIAFIEPDATGRRCYRCWVVANIWPHGTTAIEGKLDRTSAFAVKELSMEFSALAFYGMGTRALGQKLLNGISHHWANPQLRKAYLEEAKPDILAVTKGYKESVETVANNKIADLI